MAKYDSPRTYTRVVYPSRMIRFPESTSTVETDDTLAIWKGKVIEKLNTFVGLHGGWKRFLRIDRKWTIRSKKMIRQAEAHVGFTVSKQRAATRSRELVLRGRKIRWFDSARAICNRFEKLHVQREGTGTRRLARIVPMRVSSQEISRGRRFSTLAKIIESIGLAATTWVTRTPSLHVSSRVKFQVIAQFRAVRLLALLRKLRNLSTGTRHPPQLFLHSNCLQKQRQDCNYTLSRARDILFFLISFQIAYWFR